MRTVEFLGSRSLLRVDVGDALVSAFLPASVDFAPGATIGLAPTEPARLRFFDVQSGRALSS